MENGRRVEMEKLMDNDIICPGSEYVIAWRPLPEPYSPERCDGE